MSSMRAGSINNYSRSMNFEGEIDDNTLEYLRVMSICYLKSISQEMRCAHPLALRQKQLRNVLINLPSCIHDTPHFLRKLEQFTDLPADAILFTVDIKSLYTNIPHKNGLRSLKAALSQPNQRPTQKPST